MNILSISVLAVVTVIICVMLKPKNAEISVMLGISCSVIILIGVLTQVSAIVTTINQIIASSGISIDYIVILLKSIGICLVTEFAVNTCKDSGSQSLASNVSCRKNYGYGNGTSALFGYFKNRVVTCRQLR